MWLAVVAPPHASSDGMSGSFIALLALFGVALTAFATYLGVRRLNSGGIKTSTATDLWTESNNMRQELRDRLEAAEAAANEATAQVAVARAEANAWRDRAMQMEGDTVRMKRQISALQRQVRELRGQS